MAVSITAAVAAVNSAFPEFLPYRVPLCIVAVAFLTWANLRGVRESATLFSVPTYAFVILVLALIASGLGRSLTGGLQAPPAPEPAALAPLTVFLVLRAFASGTTALTGIEAISNGVPAFKPPEPQNAGKTLIAMAGLLAFMFLGITFLAGALGIQPSSQETVVSQIGRQVFGEGLPYLALQAATALVLFLAANTPFAGFPRLSAILARDGHLPHQLANLGDRLVYGNGMIALSVLASILIVAFGGRTHGLIPLYAVGVFLAFTLSQAGMIRHWQTEGGSRWRAKATVNGVGATVTFLVFLVFAATKFADGAWIVVGLIPFLVWLFGRVRGHYDDVGEQLTLEGVRPESWRDAATQNRQKVIVPVSGIHRGTLPALRFARSLSKDVTAVMVDVDPKMTQQVQEKWPIWGQDVPLVVLPSPLRSTLGPLLKYLGEVDRRDPERGPAVVVLPEFIPARWWHEFLHNQTARLIKASVLYRWGRPGKDRVIVDVPFHLKR